MAEWPLSPVALLARAAARAPDAEALVAGACRLGWHRFADATAGFAAQLAALGAGGERVAFLLGNSPQLAIGLFAAQAAGAAAVPLNPDYSETELASPLATARPRIAITLPALAERLRTALGPHHTGDLLILPEDAATWLAGLPAGEPLSLPDPDTLALLPFTGGTTGQPKAVMLTHRAIATNVWQRERHLPTRWADERILVAMPLFHAFAQAMGLLLAANRAGTLVLQPRYHPETLQQAIRAERITRLPAGPALLQSLLAWDGFNPAAFRHLRSVWSGSAPLPLATLRRWKEATGVPIHEGYGQTEAGPVLTYQADGDTPVPGSVGTPLPLTAIEIRDLETGTPMPTGETGEIAAQGPQLMAGYLGDPEATAAALQNGWLLTGDIGHLDSRGRLFITDRRKDMAIVNGFNVYPREVDEVLMRCPGVTAAAAVAVPDARRGEVLWAYVEGSATEPALTAHAEAHLVRYKRPTEWRLVAALPRTPVGKVDKVALRRLARAERHGG
jgi:long-chain acyl-CoA synthetase